MVKNEKAKEHQTRWSCLYYGSYPANEVVNEPFDAVDDYALAPGDVIVDPSLFSQLEQATWDEDDDTVVGERRYHRLNSENAISAAEDREQHYRWKDLSAWHYFAYAPIKWRVLKISGTHAVLLADRMPDTHPFQNSDGDTDWSRSDVRSTEINQ